MFLKCNNKFCNHIAVYYNNKWISFSSLGGHFDSRKKFVIVWIYDQTFYCACSRVKVGSQILKNSEHYIQ